MGRLSTEDAMKIWFFLTTSRKIETHQTLKTQNIESKYNMTMNQENKGGGSPEDKQRDYRKSLIGKLIIGQDK